MNNHWTIEKIKQGFDKFLAENGRLPIAPEIDGLDYLPSSRQIQRKFGGLEKLRTSLGYESVNFGKGIFRSQIASRAGVRGRDAEILLEKILTEKFGEVFVHTEKLYGSSKNRVDFYVYSPSGNFGIDVFYTDTLKDLQKNVNLKLSKYRSFSESLLFVVGNSMFSQKELNKCMENKKFALPSNTSVVCIDKLNELISPMSVYPNPLKGL